MTRHSTGEVKLPKKIGLLYGQERSFPPALAEEINRQVGRQGRRRSRASVGPLCQDIPADYDVILDRISHEVPFYRTYLKQAAAAGVQVVNNPFWWSCDDKFFNNVVARACGVAVPKTGAAPAQGASAEHEGRVVLEPGLPRRLGVGLQLSGIPDLHEARRRRRLARRVQGRRPRVVLQGLRPHGHRCR